MPFLTPGELPDPGLEPTSLASPALEADSLSLSHGGSPQINYTSVIITIVIIILIMEPTLQAREDVICLPFSCPSAPLPVVTVGEGVAGHVPAEQVVPVSFSGMPRQGRLEALPCDQGGLSSF